MCHSYDKALLRENKPQTVCQLFVHQVLIFWPAFRPSALWLAGVNIRKTYSWPDTIYLCHSIQVCYKTSFFFFSFHPGISMIAWRGHQKACGVHSIVSSPCHDGAGAAWAFVYVRAWTLKPVLRIDMQLVGPIGF